MENRLPSLWLKNLEQLDIAFQPIVNIHTAKTYAVEALLRNYQDIGFQTIHELFDHISHEGLLYKFDLALREKALQKFTTLRNYNEYKLFYNLDNRLLEMEDFSSGNTVKLLEKYGIQKNSLCFEISERFEIKHHYSLEAILHHYKDEGFCIAIDDFGVGYSGYKLLYDATPNVIKIDRFFLSNIEKDLKKKLLVRNITHLAIELGIKVIAEGVETKEELLTCRDIGCHLVQGFLVQKPTRKSKKILPYYEHITSILSHATRDRDEKSRIESHIQKSTPFSLASSMNDIIDFFKKNKEIEIISILDESLEPLGIIQESKIKEFLYSPYGRSLLLNDTTKSKLKNLLTPCGHTDVQSSLSTIIELFANHPESVGIVITKNAKYHGFLSAKAIINIMNEENLIYAREQNPLTKLPGNTLIEKYLSDVSSSKEAYMLCYFDLDNFKAFNDVYGFRSGDRVIQLFGDILKKHLSHDYFKAHIGGDDFFVAIASDAQKDILDVLQSTIVKFENDAREFYSAQDRERGYITTKDREMQVRNFPLLSVSASAVFISSTSKERSLQKINELLAMQKKSAKNNTNHLCISSLL
jgi:diguanylate cyclase (GGDEF)-like protein